MTTAISTPVTSKPMREPSRELTEKELAHVSGGIIAVLVGMRSDPTPALPPR